MIALMAGAMGGRHRAPQFPTLETLDCTAFKLEGLAGPCASCPSSGGGGAGAKAARRRVERSSCWTRSRVTLYRKSSRACMYTECLVQMVTDCRDAGSSGVAPAAPLPWRARLRRTWAAAAQAARSPPAVSRVGAQQVPAVPSAVYSLRAGSRRGPPSRPPPPQGRAGPALC